MGRRDMNNGNTNSRGEQGAGGVGYRMVSADRGHENVWASSDYTGVLGRTS